jgi:hypothetical protein
MSRCPAHNDHDCPSSCIWRSRSEGAAALAALDDEGPVQWWAVIELPTGQRVQRTTRRPSVTQDWLGRPRNRLIEYGVGPAPWESTGTAAAPAPPTDREVQDQPAPPAAPAPAAMVSQQAADVVADTFGNPKVTVTTEPGSPMAAPATTAPAPAEPRSAEDGAAPRSARPDPSDSEAIEQVLAHLSTIPDSRIRTQVDRIRRVLAELRDNGGQAVHPRYRISEAGF